MPAHSINIHQVAHLARLELTEEEAATYSAQLDLILGHVDTLAKLDLSGIEPCCHALPVHDVVRADTTLPGLTQTQALLNAPRSVLAQFQIPKVIE